MHVGVAFTWSRAVSLSSFRDRPWIWRLSSRATERSKWRRSTARPIWMVMSLLVIPVFTAKAAHDPSHRWWIQFFGPLSIRRDSDRRVDCQGPRQRCPRVNSSALGSGLIDLFDSLLWMRQPSRSASDTASAAQLGFISCDAGHGDRVRRSNEPQCRTRHVRWFDRRIVEHRSHPRQRDRTVPRCHVARSASDNDCTSSCPLRCASRTGVHFDRMSTMTS